MKIFVTMMLAGLLLCNSVSSGQDAPPAAAKSGDAAADGTESDEAISDESESDEAEESDEEEKEEESNDILSREKFTGDWGGRRDQLIDSGITIDFDGTYILRARQWRRSAVRPILQRGTGRQHFFKRPED
jgi:hypothetical protein